MCVINVKSKPRTDYLDYSLEIFIHLVPLVWILIWSYMITVFTLGALLTVFVFKQLLGYWPLHHLTLQNI